MSKKHGAIPPPNVAWQDGKTAASISFVKDAEEYIKKYKFLDEIVSLKLVVKQIKVGKIVLNDWLTIEEFLGPLK